MIRSFIQAAMFAKLGVANATPSLSASSFLAENSAINVNGAISTGSLFAELFAYLYNLFISVVYFVCKLVWNLLDVVQLLINKMAGIGSTEDALSFDNPIFDFLLNKKVLQVFEALFIIAIILLIVFTIFAIVKTAYQHSRGGSDDNAGYIMRRAFKAGGLLVFVPVVLLVFIVLVNSIAASLNNVFKTSNIYTTFGGEMFAAASYDANRYRQYADANIRIPILIDFDDPLDGGSKDDYSTEQLAEIYKSFTKGHIIYNNFAEMNFPSFDKSLYYNSKTGALYNNSATFDGYESFICTREQYYVMADFIDYAVRANLSFTIKNAADHDIDWRDVSDAIYDEESHALTIKYMNNGAEQTVVYETNYLEPTTPMQDAIGLIYQILGLTEDDAAHNFPILDRLQEGGLNNVDWQKDKALLQITECEDGTLTITNGTYDENGKITSGEVYGVSLLTKREYWASIGGFNITGEYAVVPIGEPTNRQYVLVEKNMQYMSDGFEAVYTLPTDDKGNPIVTFVEMGSDDLLEDMFIRVTWPEKLLQDISVIFEDLNIQELILSGKWGEALGEIEKIIDSNASTSGNTASFSTSMIHPFGLILSELFMGDLYYPEPFESAASINFSSSYSEEMVRALLLTIMGEENYFTLRTQLEYYMELFNNMMAPVLDDIASAEGFDMTDGDEQSVILYTYKAYLASLLLGQDFSTYFADFAVESLMSSVLLQYLNNLESIPTTTLPQTFIDIFNNVFNDGFNTDNQPMSIQVLYSFLNFANEQSGNILGSLANNPNFTNVKLSVPEWLRNYNKNNWENVLLIEKLSGNAAAINIEKNLSTINKVIEDTYNRYVKLDNNKLGLSNNYQILDVFNAFVSEFNGYSINVTRETYENLSTLILQVFTAEARIEEVQNTVVFELDKLLSSMLDVKKQVEENKNLSSDEKKALQQSLSNYYNKVSTFKTEMLTYASAQTQQYQLVRYYISASVSMYLSERQTSEMTVILNGKSYNVSLNTMSAKMVEYILGNTPTGKKAFNQIKNGVAFENLDYLAKTMMYTLQADTLSNYNATKDETYKKLYDAITSYMGGNTKGVDLQSIANALENMYKEMLYTKTTDEDGNEVYTYEFMFIENDFEGLLNVNGECFTTLKTFLYEFGNVCFDLMYKTNLKDVAYSQIDISNTYKNFYTSFANFLYQTMCAQSSTEFVNKNISLIFDKTNTSQLDPYYADVNIDSMLAFLGLSFDDSYALKDYRMQVLSALNNFTNRAGESATSYSMRYLTLFYLATAQNVTKSYVENNQTKYEVTAVLSNRNTRAMMMRLAGLQNRPESELVGLDYASDVMDVIVNSEEKGAVYIICTYDPETLRYKPFIMSGDAKSGLFPCSAYISNKNASIPGYPVIAKGVMTQDGLPTAIREVGGNISFYRKNITVVNTSEVGLSAYYQSYESVNVHYGFIGGIINTVYKIFSGKTITQQLMESVPRIKIDYNINLPFGTRTQEVALLSQGDATLNYNFDVNRGISMQLLYSPADLNPIVLIAATFFLFVAIIKIVWALIKRIFNITVLFLVSPPIISTIMLDTEGHDKDNNHTTTSFAFNKWKQSLIENVLLIVSVVLTLNIYFMILPMINNIELFTEDSFVAITNIGLFKNASLQAVNGLARIVFMLVAITLITTGPQLLGKIFGVSDAVSEGATVSADVSNMAKEVQYYASGRNLADTTLLAKESLDNSLLGKSVDKVRKVHNKVKDAKQGKKVADEVMARTGDADLAKRAGQALMNARVSQRNAEKQAHNTRVKAAQARKKAQADRNK